VNWLYHRKHGCTAAIHDNQALPLFEVQQMKQATKANRAQVEQHISNQRRYGERMIGGLDIVRPVELIVTGGIIVCAILWAYFA
jgi:hypothetical protein